MLRLSKKLFAQTVAVKEKIRKLEEARGEFLKEKRMDEENIRYMFREMFMQN